MASSSVTLYLSQVLKSVKFAAIESFKETMPVTTNLVEQNQEVAKKAFKDILDLKKSLPRLGRLQDNILYKTANQWFTNLKEDITTGVFYHDRTEQMDMGSLFESISSMTGEAMDPELKALLSGDFGALDDEEDEENNGETLPPSYEDRPELMITRGDALVAACTINSQAKASNCIAQTMANLHEHDIMDRRTTSSIAFQQNEQMIMINRSGWQTMAEGFNRVLDFNNEVIRTHAQNSQKFYEEMLKTTQDIHSSIQGISEIYKKVNRLQIEAEKTGEDDPENIKVDYNALFQNGFNANMYYDVVAKRIAKSELATMFNMFKSILK